MDDKRNQGGGYSTDLDKLLTEFKVKDENEGFACRLLTYNNAKPKLEITRHYRDRQSGQWMKERKAGRARIPWMVLDAIIRNWKALEKGYGDWERSQRDQEREPGDDSF